MIQKKLARNSRIIHHEGRLVHTNCLFKQIMHSLKFHDLVKYRTASVMFKLYYGKLPTLLQSRFNRSQNIHNTRSRNTFIIRYSRTNLKAMCISVWGVKLWNALPVNIKEIRSMYTFKQTPRYDVENIGLEFAVEVKNRFNRLQLADREPEELWNDIRDIVKETADKRVPKVKRKKVTKWLSDEAVKIADERREVRNKGDDKEYRRLNAAFQRRARQDNEQSIKEKCRQIEEINKMGRTRELYREIKEMTGSYSSRCGAMKLSTGKVVTEGKEVKEIWQQWTEELYRRDPNATDSFNENIYDDEPEVMEIEVREALRHISNRKSAGCDVIPIELLKAGGRKR